MESAPRQRWFTPEEVDAIIPRLEHVVGEILQRAQRVREQVLDLSEQLGCDPHDLDRATLLSQAPWLEDELRAIATLHEEIRGYGGILRGSELGLVDFPARIDGEEVFLCWQHGEPAVAYYHRTDEGFAGRKRLERPGVRLPRLQ